MCSPCPTQIKDKLYFRVFLFEGDRLGGKGMVTLEVRHPFRREKEDGGDNRTKKYVLVAPESFGLDQ